MLLIHLLLTLVWLVLTNDLTVLNLLFGWLLVWGVLWVTAYRPEHRRYVTRLRKIAVMAVVFFKELVIANLRVAMAVIRPADRLRPGIVAVPLDVESDAALTLLANLVTLTPGTLSLDVSSDRRTLYVHVMDLDDPEAFRRNLKAVLERRVQEALE
jgi:multicomponent Na+:H+ antiporter subunit E